jgi:hypothetical protein
MRQYSQLFCLGLQIWISEMLQYHPELEVVELVQDGPTMHYNDSTQCVGLVSTNQDNFLGPHKKHICQVWLNSVWLFSRRR